MCVLQPTNIDNWMISISAKFSVSRVRECSFERAGRCVSVVVIGKKKTGKAYDSVCLIDNQLVAWNLPC